jgi:serine protease AprX
MKLLILLLMSITLSVSGQEKYFIYFKDKGGDASGIVAKANADANTAKQYISERAVERRKKNMGEDFFSIEDLPVSKNYIQKLKDNGTVIVHELSWFNSVSAYLTSAQKEFVLTLPFVEKIEPVKRLKYITPIRSDEAGNLLNKNSGFNNFDYGESLVQLQLSDIPIVHSKGITGENVIIGFLDTGYEWQTHEALSSRNIIAEWDFINNDNNTANQPGQDTPNQHDHGTYCFSITSGFKEGKLVGASFNSSFLLAKTEHVPTETHAEEDNYAAALIWMEGLGADISTSSLGYTEFDDWSYTYNDMNGNTTIVTKAVNAAFNRGMVTITSAGNEGNSPWRYISAPADAYNVISVGAVTNLNQVAGFSSRGPTSDGRIKPEVVTQGVMVYGAAPPAPDNYRFASGTSAAAPIAAGVAGLLLSAYPHLTNVQVRSIFLESAANATTPDNNRGYGLLSAERALAFPNLQSASNNIRLHKMFFAPAGIDPATVRLNFKIGEGDYMNVLMQSQGVSFSYNFNSLTSGQAVSFYFTFTDFSGNNIREPEGNRIYKFNSSDVIVSLNIDLPVPVDYGIVSQNYPNPFNSLTTINYIAQAGSNVALRIYNVLGEKVYEQFIANSAAGENRIVWNGVNMNGEQSPSGPYFYNMTIDGASYSKKMVLLK